MLPLTEQKRWIVWQWELRKGKSGKEKWTKPPRQARDPAYNARSNDPDSWGTYDEAAVMRGNLSRRIPDMSASAKRRSWGGRTRDIPAEP